ncbi:MAG: hypothetical protein R3B70_20300 [Polyangiaceae bacterium]
MTKRTKLLSCSFVAALLPVLAAGCSQDATFYYGDSLSDLRLSLYTDDEGIHPDTSALEDPMNPFADSALGPETKWNIQAGEGAIPAFYVWATVLAREPTGEAQYYVGLNLGAAYLSGDSRVEDPEAVRDQAIRAYQTVLDEFPDSVTYDATGTITYDLATPAYQGIVGLGGTVQGGWFLVTTENGQKRAVKP